MDYRYETATIEGFVQQLAVSYVAHGYWFYVTGVIPEGKDPRRVDEKLLGKYGIEISKFTRARRKLAGQASVQYLRHRRFFVIAATHGAHRFFSSVVDGGEGERIRDCRKVPIRFASYAISYHGGHAHVRIDVDTFRELKAYFLDHACHWSTARLEGAIRGLPFEPYAPVRGQLVSLWRLVNRVRKTAQLEPLAFDCLKLRRRIVKPFGLTTAAADEAIQTRRPASTVETSSDTRTGLVRTSFDDSEFGLDSARLSR